MAKATPGRGGSAKKAAVPKETVRKKTKAAAPPAKQPGVKKAAEKKTAGKKADAKKAVGKKADVKTVGTKRAEVKKPAAAAKKPASGKAPVQMQAARKTPAKPAVAKQSATAKKPAAKKPAAATVAPVRTVAVKQAAPRRPNVRVAAPIPTARRARPAPAPALAPRKAPQAPRLGGNGTQVFTVSHLQEADFKADGLRSYALYRDLGIAEATAGLARAHVIRFVPPCTDAVRKQHSHETELQLVYVLKGWIKNEFEGHGEQMMSTGSCWLQPSGIRHTVLDYSPDCEVLEIIVPADFTTDDPG
jgi:uncharacterized RmlC-like cupin family protein